MNAEEIENFQKPGKKVGDIIAKQKFQRGKQSLGGGGGSDTS